MERNLGHELAFVTCTTWTKGLPDHAVQGEFRSPPVFQGGPHGKEWLKRAVSCREDFLSTHLRAIGSKRTNGL
jgi:hypothetical protein